MQTQHARDHALVIGGGIAGLVTARVLLKHFQRVTIVERDHYPDRPTFRAGTPQSHHLHQILLKGQDLLAELFPGIETKLRAQGAFSHNYGGQTITYYGGARCLRVSVPSLEGWYCSRLLLEYTLHQELLNYTNLEILEKTEVIELLYRAESHTVTGVKTRTRAHTKDTSPITRAADLVVDASGSNSQLSQWLKQHHLPVVEETPDHVDLGYATRVYDRPANFAADWQQIAIQGGGQGKHGGALATLENGQWMVVLAGLAKEYPPTDDKGFLDFVRNLPDPILYETIIQATPASKIYGYRRAKNHLRHFERLNLPEQLLVLGDAVCSFNPIYGQGMTVATMEAVALDRELGEWSVGKAGFTRHFQRIVARIIATPWLMATAAEDEFVHKNMFDRLAAWYLDGIIRLLSSDLDACVAFAEVLHMKTPIMRLAHPKLLFKVLGASRRSA